MGSPDEACAAAVGPVKPPQRTCKPERNRHRVQGVHHAFGFLRCRKALPLMLLLRSDRTISSFNARRISLIWAAMRPCVRSSSFASIPVPIRNAAASERLPNSPDSTSPSSSPSASSPRRTMTTLPRVPSEPVKRQRSSRSSGIAEARHCRDVRLSSLCHLYYAY